MFGLDVFSGEQKIAYSPAEIYRRRRDKKCKFLQRKNLIIDIKEINVVKSGLERQSTIKGL